MIPRHFKFVFGLFTSDFPQKMKEKESLGRIESETNHGCLQYQFTDRCLELELELGLWEIDGVI